MDSRQATTTPECIVPHSTATAPFSLQPYTINTLFRSAKHIFCAEIYTYTPGANPPETTWSALTNQITPTLVSSLTPIKRLLELFLQFYSNSVTKLTNETLQIWSNTHAFVHFRSESDRNNADRTPIFIKGQHTPWTSSDNIMCPYCSTITNTHSKTCPLFDHHKHTLQNLPQEQEPYLLIQITFYR